MREIFNITLLKRENICLSIIIVLSIILNFSLSGCNYIPAPSNLQAKAVSSSQIDLLWNDDSSNEQGFKIERSVDASTFVQIATVSADVKSYIDTGLVINTTYYYRVMAFNDNSHSLYSNVASAKTNVVTWSKTFGGQYNDQARSIQQTSDGGYIVAGSTSSYGAGYDDMWIIKLDLDGNMQWNKTFGGANYDSANCIQQTSDGGYIVAGSTNYYKLGTGDMWILKLDGNGNKIWEKTFNGDKSYFDYANSIQQTTDGGYIVVGIINMYTLSEGIWILKLDANGNMIWNKIYNQTNRASGNLIQQTKDGGYIVAGYTSLNGNTDMLILKLDQNGNKIWEKTFDMNSLDWAFSIQQTKDGGYIVAGSTNATSNYSMWILKLDQNGNKIWDLTYGDTVQYDISIQQTKDDGYIAVNTNAIYNSEIWITKIDPNGNRLWVKTFSGSTSGTTDSVKQTKDGGYIVGGYSNSDFLILKLDENGEIH